MEYQIRKLQDELKIRDELLEEYESGNFNDSVDNLRRTQHNSVFINP